MWEEAPILLHSQTFDPTTLDIEPSSQEELYNQIISDCDMAIATMTSNTRLNHGRAGKASAIVV